jgi:hypothetical protein
MGAHKHPLIQYPMKKKIEESRTGCHPISQLLDDSSFQFRCTYLNQKYPTIKSATVFIIIVYAAPFPALRRSGVPPSP